MKAWAVLFVFLFIGLAVANNTSDLVTNESEEQENNLKKLVYEARNLTEEELEKLREENFLTPPVIEYPHEKWVSPVIEVKSEPAEKTVLPEYDPDSLNSFECAGGRRCTAEELAAESENKSVHIETTVVLGEPINDNKPQEENVFTEQTVTEEKNSEEEKSALDEFINVIEQIFSSLFIFS